MSKGLSGGGARPGGWRGGKHGRDGAAASPAAPAAGPKPPVPRRTWAVSVTLFVAIVALALGARLLASPGADTPARLRELLGRASRLDAYWYTHWAVENARGGTPLGPASPRHDRPLYTAWCTAVYRLAGGPGPVTLALPAIIAGSLGAGLVFAVGRRAGLRRPVAALGGLFAATCWIAAIHDREPLIYSTVVAAALAAILVWLAGLRRRPFFAAGWGLLALAAAALKPTLLLAAPGLGVAQVEASGPGRPRRKLALAGALAGLGALWLAGMWLFARRLLMVGLRELGERTAIFDLRFPADAFEALADASRVLLLTTHAPALAALAFFGAGAIILEGPPAPGDRRLLGRRALVFWVLAGCLVAGLFTYRPTRHLTILFPPVFLLAAHGAAVLAGSAPAPVRGGPRRSAIVLGVTLFLGFAAALAFFPFFARNDALRLGIAAAASVLIATGAGPALARAGRIRPRAWLAVLLVGGAFLEDAALLIQFRLDRTYDDLAARRSFETIVAPGARVQGFAAQYLAFDPRYETVFRQAIDPKGLARNADGSTHLATFWVPELRYVEQLMRERGAPLARVADLTMNGQTYRIYRLADAARRGYVPTPFEQARALEDSGKVGEAAKAFREIVAAGTSDPVVLTHAGTAIARVAPDEGEALLRRAISLAPRATEARRMLEHLQKQRAARPPAPPPPRPPGGK